MQETIKDILCSFGCGLFVIFGCDEIGLSLNTSLYFGAAACCFGFIQIYIPEKDEEAGFRKIP